MIGIGSDHGGFQTKQIIIEYLENNHIHYHDYGTYNEESTDYPIYALQVGEAVRTKQIEKGILVCTTGIGMEIACNKVKTVRDVELLADLSEDKKRNKRQSKVIIDAVEKYKNAVSKLDKNDEAYSNNKGMAFDVCMEELSGRKINMATMQYLVRYAINNESIRDSLLVVLHDKDMELFLEMFKKSPES